MMISIIIPAYNEEKAIGGELSKILEIMENSSNSWEIIVVDDGSQDKTVEIVESFQNVKLIKHEHNSGGGVARNTGIKAARGDVVVIVDGDGTYPVQDIPRLVEELKDCDMVVGARKKEAGTLKFLRVPAKFFIRKLAEFVSGRKIPDLNSGMRAIRRDKILPYLNLFPEGHSWVSTLTLTFWCNGLSVKYMPIDYYPRKGVSSFHPISDTAAYLMTVLRTVTWFKPMKILLPMGLLFLFIGLGKMFADILRYNWHITPSTVILIIGGFQVLALALIADMINKKCRS